MGIKLPTFVFLILIVGKGENDKFGFVGVNYNKILAHSRRGEHRSPVKKCDTYGIIALFADYKFIIST